MKSYKERQRSFNCEIGDIVRIFKKPDRQELNYWGSATWAPEMDMCVGKYGKILDIIPDGILIKVDGVPGTSYQQYGWYFPYFCLDLVR